MDSKESDAEHGSAGLQREREGGPRAQLLIAPTIASRSLRQLVPACELDDASLPELPGRPRELRLVHDRQGPADPVHGPGKAHGGPTGSILVKAGPIQPQELHDPLQARLDLDVHIPQRRGNQSRGDIGQQALETQLVGERPRRAPPAQPLEQEPADEQRLEEDQQPRDHEPPSLRVLGDICQQTVRVPRVRSVRERRGEEQGEQGPEGSQSQGLRVRLRALHAPTIHDPAHETWTKVH